MSSYEFTTLSIKKKTTNVNKIKTNKVTYAPIFAILSNIASESPAPIWITSLGTLLDPCMQ